MGAKEIKAAITTKLTAAATLTEVKKWLQAEPSPTRYPASCFGWVEYDGGNRAPKAGRFNEVNRFFVVIVRKGPDPEVNENTAIDLATAATTVLEADHTLGGTCFESYVSNREKQKIFQGDYDLVAVRLTVHTERYV